MTDVTLNHITRRFDETVAVNALNLEINSGELVAFLGPSGCGKTTTLRMISGLLAPSVGDICFDGQSVLSIPAEKRGAVMVFQNHLLFPMMNVAKNIGFGLKMQQVNQKEIDRRVSEMLARVQLPDYGNRQPHELSGGQQQRIALARALIVRPKVLLLDEPLANLDANLRLEMRELIREIQRDMGITTIFVTHDQEEAVMLADRIALMFDGELAQYATPQAFYQRPQTQQVAHFFRNDNFLPAIRIDENTVQTAVGILKIDSEYITETQKNILLTVRPEDIKLIPEGNDNLVSAQVRSSVYMGTYTQVQLEIGDHLWLSHGTADFMAIPGEMISVQLPAARIWLLPDDEIEQNRQSA
ncbi:MAG: ABC transporter ATP-binding protein [Aggregatilineales bacterium]